MGRSGLPGTNGQGIPGISTRHDTSWMAYPRTTDQKVGRSNLPGRAIASTDYHDTPSMLASCILRRFIGIVLFQLAWVWSAHADIPEPMSCVVANARMAQLLPEHERLFREKTLFFAFQHARRDLPADADWSNEDLRGKVAGRITDVYGELASSLGSAPDDDVSADALHCNGSEAEFEIHYQTMILMLGERAYNSLAQRFVAHRE